MIKLLKKLVGLILSPLIKLIDFPVVPDGLAEYINKFLDYIKQGMGFISYFLPMTLVKALLTFVIACRFQSIQHISAIKAYFQHRACYIQ